MMIQHPRLVRQQIELGNQANVSVNFVSIGGTDEYEAQFLHRVSGECLQTGRGNTLEKAFTNAHNGFDASGYKKSPRELAEENARLRERIESVESNVADDSSGTGTAKQASDRESDSGGDVTPVKRVRRKRTTKTD
jgi:hypothetical protein